MMKLSICIPTYNREKYLDEALASIIGKVDEKLAGQVEICISDNASTDGTDQLIHRWQANCPVQIVYSRNKENMGADNNYLRVIELASGEYCWFFGSDDLLCEGGLRRMLEEIKTEKDIYLCNRVECDINMHLQRERYWLTPTEPQQIFRMSDEAEFLRYLNHAQSIGALFSYLSSIVFKRQRWDQYQIDPIFIGSAYSHVYMLLSFIADGCELVYVRDPLILCRGQNDSFESEGVVKRIMLDIEGYGMLANKFFAENRVKKTAFLNVLKKDRPSIRTLIFIRLRTDDAMWKKIVPNFTAAQYRRIEIGLIGIAKPLLILLKKIRSTP